MVYICTSCKKNVFSKKNFVRFECPNCFKSEIIRCDVCKSKSNPYYCSKCKFKGP